MNHGNHGNMHDMHGMHNMEATTAGMHHIMDHAGHHPVTDNPHAGHTIGSDGGHNMMSMMSMSFHFSKSETVLFDSWKFTTTGGLIGSMIGIFFLAALYEGLKYYREYLFWRTYNALQYRAVNIPVEKGVVNDDNQVVHMVGEVIHKQPPTMLSIMHFFQTLLHVVQITLSYFLMLIFMTYNVWLCIAVVVGAAVGYFLFGWKKSVIVDVTEHCH